ncbi:glycosyltransferase family 2 protein [uncultured Polaribacter sp.]|uniref:glycosyltransferase family 2 protein n=1 Tax=uncultured Polaribacter sp. TaxID=174711 RepID=UPI00260D02AE|nr:glycosyltransferase family 2 protein [uncultured Polaribacter sp.]
MANQPLVSIITPSYNSSDYLSETIKTVLSQSYKNWEMIIVDDCSTDATEKIVNSYLEKDSRIKFFKNKINSGPALSRNKAIEYAKGRFISFLDSDDLWIPNKLEKQVEFMLSNNYPFTYSFYSQIDEKGVFIKNIDNLPKFVTYKSSMKSNKIGCLTAIFDTDFYGKLYMEDLANRQDYTLWLKLLKKYDKAYCCPYILAKYRVRNNSISSNKFKLIKYHWVIYKEIEKQNFFMSVYYLSNYIISKFYNQ